jgi:uncharacterized protein (TIGR03086 family)
MRCEANNLDELPPQPLEDLMETVALLGRVVAETTRLVDGTTGELLERPTPCEGWTARDIINHITGGATMFAMSAESGSVPDDLVAQLMGGDNIGDDPQGAFKVAATRALAAFEDPAVLDKMVTLPFGTMPAGVALNIAVFDVATHAADLAVSTGQQIEDLAILEAALEIGKQMVGPDLRTPGVFDAEQAADADAPIQDRLLAFAGRRL